MDIVSVIVGLWIGVVASVLVALIFYLLFKVPLRINKRDRSFAIYEMHSRTHSPSVDVLRLVSLLENSEAMPSVTFWATSGIWVGVSTVLYVRVLYVIKSSKNAMYDTFFFRQFFSQGLFDMSFFAVYAVFYSLPSSINMALNGTVLIRMQYLQTYYFLYAQVLGICTMSLNRLFIMHALSPISTFCETIPQLLVFLIQLIIPFLLVLHSFFQAEPYYLMKNGAAVREIPPNSVKVNATQAAVTTSAACAICAVSYLLLLRKLIAYSKSLNASSARGKFIKRERTLSAMAFTLFVALCVVTAYYVTILIGIRLNSKTYRWVTSYYAYIIAVISFMNPWALIATNSSTRKRVFRPKHQSNLASSTSPY